VTALEISWFGLGCIRITERGFPTIVIDPYDARAVGYAPLKLKADIVITSQNTPDQGFVDAVRGDPFRIQGPGEYEIGHVFITGTQTSSELHKPDPQGRNTFYTIDIEGFHLLHAGCLDHVPSQSEIEGLGPVELLMLPVGGGATIGASKAAELANTVEPNLVLPLRYKIPGGQIPLDDVQKFLKEMGISELRPQPVLKLGRGEALPEETKVVLLEPAGVA
jgi:L-ascorbate metabolism protein UlaG (beta-lactamase superfamily)